MASTIAQPIPASAVPSGRLASLDTFRGMTIAGMLIVNNAGDWGHVFSPLGHSEWNGVTCADFVFPFFLFIMGVAMPFSFAKRLRDGAAPASLMPGVARRAAMLFGLGFLLNLLYAYAIAKPPRGWEVLQSVRVLGVLQRIGICYLIAAPVFLWGRERALVIVSAIVLFGYYALMTLVSVPGHGPGVLTQAGNLASHIDTLVFGRHCYEWDAATGLGHDPEGLLGTLPAVANALIGCLVGIWLRRTERDGYERASAIFVGGVLLVIAGAWWSLSFPFNKNLWTSSYVLFTSGWACLVLGCCYWTIDLKGRSGWTLPFTVYGTNAIASYVCASAMAYTSVFIKWAGPDGKFITLKGWIFSHAFGSWITPAFGPYVASAAYGISYVILWSLIMLLLYRRRIFIRI